LWSKSKFFESLAEKLIDFGRAQFASPNTDEPPELSYLWYWFLSISRDRDFDPVSFVKSSEYLAWQKLNHVQLSPFELLVIRRLDSYYVSWTNGNKTEEVIPKDMTPDLFDNLLK
jgi:hypothetical protein